MIAADAQPGKRLMNRRNFVLTLLALPAAGCLGRNTFTIGSKNFTEQLVLGEMLAQLLERNRWSSQFSPEVERRFYLAGTYICHQALLAGRIDLYVEYTGTALAAILRKPPMSGNAAVYDLVKDEYRRRFDLEVLPPLGFDNSFAIVVRGDDARRLRMNAISDLARVAPQWRLGVGYEFLERKDGYAGLAETYGLKFAQPPRVMDLGLLYRALQSRLVDVIAASNTDGLISALDLAVLADDRHYFPPYDAVPVARRGSLARYPQIRELFNTIAGKVTADDMRRLNYAVDGQHRDVPPLVSDFLRKKRLINAGM
jgi:glycine betaine/choline ABC-type transport system substrate-binding protein